jgi:hypothetical protein
LALGACIGGKKVSEDDKVKLAAYIQAAPPASASPLDIDYDGKVHLVAYRVDKPSQVGPGAEVKVTLYWRCDQVVGEGWSLFTHVADPVSGQILNLDWNGPIREQRGEEQVLGPSRWEVGKVYVDEQSFTVPDWEGMGPELEFRVGVWKGNDRLKVLRGPTDGNQAGVAARIKLNGGKVTSPSAGGVPELIVPKVPNGQAITIDGKANEPAWAEAAQSGPFVNVASGRPATGSPIQGSVRLLWDDTTMYVYFEVRDQDLRGGFDAKQNPKRFTATGLPKLWEVDTVEIMTDPDGDGDNINYYELQINPENKVFHSQFDSYNAPRGGENGPFGHEDWDPKLRSAVDVRGTIDKSSDKDDGYSVEIAIPFAAFSKAKRTPPAMGDVWRMNFYAMEDNGGVAWSPILGQGNFHKATRFGRVVWGKVDPNADGGGVQDAGPDVGPQASKDAGTEAGHRASQDGGAQKGLDASPASGKDSATQPARDTTKVDAGRRGVVKLP